MKHQEMDLTAESYEQLIQRFVRWAETEENVRAAVIIGSRSRTDHPADEWADPRAVAQLREVFAHYETSGGRSLPRSPARPGDRRAAALPISRPRRGAGHGAGPEVARCEEIINQRYAKMRELSLEEGDENE